MQAQEIGAAGHNQKHTKRSSIVVTFANVKLRVYHGPRKKGPLLYFRGEPRVFWLRDGTVTICGSGCEKTVYTAAIIYMKQL